MPVGASPLSAGGDSFCTYIFQNIPVPQIKNAGGSP
jgi:hypothetical protein